MNISVKGVTFDAKFFIGDNLTKEFSELRKLNKTKRVTVVYAAFWIINQTVFKITDILFSLKDQMESNPRVPHGAIVCLDEKTNSITPVSSQWWYEDEYRKSDP